MAFTGQIPERLKQAIANRACIVFVGAGLSASVLRSDGRPLPVWSGLLLELLELADKEGIPIPDASEIRDLISTGKLLEAGQEIRNALPDDLQRFFLDIFGDSGLLPTQTHHDLAGIPFAGVMTSNYDALLEGAAVIKSGGKIPFWFTQVDFDPTLPSPLRSRTFFVLKAHGDYRKISSVILGTRDYQDLLYKAPGYRYFLEQAFGHYTLLFLGYGGNDPDFDEVLNKLSTLGGRSFDPHFVLLPTGRLSSVQRHALRRDKRLQVIEYTPDAKHSQVSEFIRALLSASVFHEPKVSAIGVERYLISYDAYSRLAAEKIADFLDSCGFSYALFAETSLRDFKDYVDLEARLRLATTLVPMHESGSTDALHIPTVLAERRGLSIFPVVLGTGPVPTSCRPYVFLRWEEISITPDLSPLLSSTARTPSPATRGSSVP